MESQAEENKVVIEVATDLRNAPRHQDIKWRLSWLARFATMGILIGREVMKARGQNIGLVVSNQGEFKRVRNFEEMKKLYSGDDKLDGG